MKYLELMKQRAAVLKRMIKAAEKEKDCFPEGHMRISQDKGRTRYYYVNSASDNSGIYITKDKLTLAAALAQKEYNEQFISKAGLELSRLENSIRLLSKSDTDEIYLKLDPRKKKFIEPYILTDDQYAIKWLEQPYKASQFKPEAKIYDTRKGEKVRSKTEAILADLFLDLGIPYRYEQALPLSDRCIRYPDFTLLKKATREEIYLEHFGLIDDEEYRNNCLIKLDEYRNGGIYLGKNLLITYECSWSPFDIAGTRRMIEEIFL